MGWVLRSGKEMTTLGRSSQNFIKILLVHYGIIQLGNIWIFVIKLSIWKIAGMYMLYILSIFEELENKL